METVRIGNKASVASVPNTLGTATPTRTSPLGENAGIGTDLVVQTAFGDWATPLLHREREDYARHAEDEKSTSTKSRS